MSTINLLPEDYLERRAQQRANILCLLLFSVVMTGVIAAAVVTEEKARQTRMIREQVNREYEEAGKLIAQVQSLEAVKKDVISKAQVAADLQERIPRSYLLACLTNALPTGASLVDVNLKTSQTRVSSAPPTVSKFQAQSAKRANAVTAVETSSAVPATSVTVEVVGLAQTDVQVAQFIATMARNELMESVDLVYSEETKREEAVVREFQVSMVMKSEAEVDFNALGIKSQDAAKPAEQVPAPAVSTNGSPSAGGEALAAAGQ